MICARRGIPNSAASRKCSMHDSNTSKSANVRWAGLIFGLILCAPCFAVGIQVDTARLARHLEPFRHHALYEFSSAEYQPIQLEYLAWVDSRIRAGASLARMNQELDSANLLSEGPKTIDEFDRTYAGFLAKIESVPLRGADDLLAIKFGIYTGGSCNIDETTL